MIWRWTAQSENRADLAILEALESGRGEWVRDAAESADAPPLSRSQLKRLIDEQKVSCNGAPIKANAKLPPGGKVEITLPPPRPSELIPEDRPLEVLYEDEHLLVLNKPPELTVHPSSTQFEGTLVNVLLHHVKDLSGIGGELRPGIVHRIDKDTSGALVITKTDAAHQKLSETFAAHDIERAYWALAYGSPAGASTDRKMKIEGAIGRNPTDRKKMAIVPRGGREAVSYIRRVEEYALPKAKPFASWLEVTLETGRTHQIRVHLTSIGHSLLGDPVYGTPSERQPKWTSLPREVQEAVRELPGQALHARVLGFRHPITGQSLRFEAEPPPAFARLLETLRKYR